MKKPTTLEAKVAQKIVGFSDRNIHCIEIRFVRKIFFILQHFGHKPGNFISFKRHFQAIVSEYVRPAWIKI